MARIKNELAKSVTVNFETGTPDFILVEFLRETLSWALDFEVRQGCIVEIKADQESLMSDQHAVWQQGHYRIPAWLQKAGAHAAVTVDGNAKVS